MTIKQTAKYRVLANVVQTTFGKSSEAKYATHFVNMTIPAENQILIRYQTIVNFGHQNVYLELRRKYKEEALEIVKKHIERVAEEYKKQVEDKQKLLEPKVEPYEEAAPKSISIKVLDSTIQESIENISMSIYNPVGTSYYRITCMAEVK